MSRFRAFSDTELACIWYALSYEDGRWITPADTDVVLVDEILVEARHRNLANSALLVLWERDVAF